jgi:ribosomal protein S18 acetylase RimI-like enzyme
MVKLVPMDPADFGNYLERSVVQYAQEHIKTGNWQPENALEKSRAEFNHLLPDGLQTKDQYIYSIVDETTNNKLGILWVKISEDGTRRRAFGYDFEIYESYRGKGYGRQALVALEGILQSMNVDFMDLHVFAHNTTAFELYKKMGFETTNLYMRKTFREK